MRRRLSILGLFGALVGVAVVAIAQPPSLPTTLPAPQALPQPAITPAQTIPGPIPVSPPIAQANEPPLSHFETLAAFSAHAQNAVRSVLLSANWLTRMNQSQGRFIYGFNPALRQPLLGDHNLHQAQAALAMAQLARFTGEEKQGAIASQSILALLTATRIDPADINGRVPIQPSSVCNRLGFAATLALAIYSLPGADARLIDEAEKLCNFLHKQCRTDGSVQYTDNSSENSNEVDPVGANDYPAVALQAIIAGNRFRPNAWKLDAAKKGISYYRSVFQAKPHPLLAANLTTTCMEFSLQAQSSEFVAFVFEMNDYICRLQIPNNDPKIPQCVGGIRTVLNGQQTDLPSGPETGSYVQSLTLACQFARQVPDLDRHGKYKSAAQDATQYLIDLQYGEANTRHFENAFRANMLIGSYHLSPNDGNIRIDATAVAVSGLLRYLAFVAQTE